MVTEEVRYVLVHKETEKAILVSVDIEDEDECQKWWVPKSIIIDWDEMGEGEWGDIVLPQWFVEQEEIEE